MQLRDYQIDIAKQGFEILKSKGLVYLNMEVRCGKTLTSLEIASNYNTVLFITKKKAISSIISDYKAFNYQFNLDVINYEQVANNTLKSYDLVILDEASSLSAFAKPSNRTKLIKQHFAHLPMIYLSGTPASESYSQWYHQFWVSNRSPFKQYTNFYKWAGEYVNVVKKNVGYAVVNDYTDAIIDKIEAVIKDYVIRFTQQEAGFESVVNHNIIYCESMNKNLIKRLQKDKVIEGSTETIIADSGAKMMQKIHQLENGTIKFESGNTQVINKYKANFIKESFKGKKIAIFYYYIAELELLKSVFENYTTDLEEFNTTDKIYIGQQYSSSMGINLSKAEYLVFYNFGFSGTNFIQSIDRLTTKYRLKNDIFFVFTKGSLTEKIYNVVKNKQTFTEKQYDRIANTIEY